MWTEVWVGEECLKTRLPSLFNCSINKDGNVVGSRSDSGWQIEFRRNLNDREVEEFSQLLQQLGSANIDQSKRDSLVWTASKYKI